MRSQACGQGGEALLKLIVAGYQRELIENSTGEGEVGGLKVGELTAPACLIGGWGLPVRARQLPGDKSGRVDEHRVDGMDAGRGRHSCTPQPPKQRLDTSEDARPDDRLGQEDEWQARVLEEDVPEAAPPRKQDRCNLVWKWARQTQITEAPLSDRIQQIPFAFDVSVDGHHPALQAAGKALNREPFQAVPIGQRQGSLDNLLTGQGPAGASRATGLDSPRHPSMVLPTVPHTVAREG